MNTAQIEDDPAQHKARHKVLHHHLDELLADWIDHDTGHSIRSPIMELIEWSYQQTLNPTHRNENR
jgi:hypothetical protein